MAQSSITRTSIRLSLPSRLRKLRPDSSHSDRNAEAASATTPPAVIYRVDPEYSEEARKAKYSGAVELRVDVDASGRVTNAAVIHSLGLGLDEKAIEAAKQWRFRPAMKDGKPIDSQVLIDLNFRLL
jgi:TonB family protein